MKVIEESGMVLGEFEEERLFLIIAEAEEGWLLGPKAELEERLMRLRKIWKADILVLNKGLAKEYGLVKMT